MTAPERPFVYVNMAMTVDGKITSARREYPKFTSPHDRDTMDRLRAEADAILVGAGTMRADDPKLHVRSKAMRDYRTSLGKTVGPVKVLLSKSLKIEPESRFFQDVDGGDRVIVTVESAPAEQVEALRRRAEVWQLGRSEVDLAEMMRRLRERGVERLLAEGGGEINWALLRADLIDEFYVTIAPAFLGGRDAPTIVEGEGFPMADQKRLKLVELRREGDELYGRWAIVR